VTIVHIITGLALGGAETSLLRLLRAQRGRFRNVVVALRSGGPMRRPMEEAGAPVIEIEADGAWATWRNLRAAAREIRALRPTLIQGWMYAGNAAATLLRAWCAPRARLVWNVRASLAGFETFPRNTRWSIHLARLLSRRPDEIVFNSHAGMREHIADGFRPRESMVITNGIERLPADAGARERIRGALGVSANTVVIANVARFDPMKDHDTLLRAAAALRDCDAHLLLAGPGVTATNDFFARRVAERGLAGRVSLLGERRDVGDLLSAADAFCLSSYTEGMPNAVAEAMAAGLPCIVTDVGDSAHLAGDTGLVVPPRDPAALAGALRSLIGMSPEARAALGERARERIAAEFGMERMIARYDELYTRLAR
jgi:glycosyltransferase involved in cell wall biosynthesis